MTSASARPSSSRSTGTGINQVVFEGRFIPSNQTEAPGSKWWDPAFPVPPRDLDGAKALLAQAGVPHPKLVLNVVNNPTDTQVGEVIQAMAAEAGFEVTLNKGEAVTPDGRGGARRLPGLRRRSGAGGPIRTAI